MSGLPKKYAKMGFKKGWKAYKKTKGGVKTKRRSISMARARPRRSRLGGIGLNKGTFTKVLAGLAVGSVIGAVAGDNKLIKGGAGWFIGGIPGALGAAFGSQLMGAVSGTMSGVSSAFEY